MDNSEVVIQFAVIYDAEILLLTISVDPTEFASSDATSASCLPISAIMFAPNMTEQRLCCLRRYSEP